MFVKERYRGPSKSKKRIALRPISRQKKFGPAQRNQFEGELEAAREEIGTDILKQTRYGKCFQAALLQLEEYCAHSTIHGVRYFVDKNRHWLERVWWIVGFVVSMFCCGALIHKVYDNWEEKSVIVSFAGNLTSVWDIPFPAVTICPSTIVQTEQFNLTEIYEQLKKHPRPPFNVTAEELEIMSAYSSICGPHDFLIDFMDNLTDHSVNDVLRKIAPSLNYTIQECRFPSWGFKCELEEIMTDMGLCFTFNMLNGKETYGIESSDYHSQIKHNKTARWNLEDGYDPNIKINSDIYPYRVSGAGNDGDRLTLNMYLSKKHLKESCFPSGFTIVLHLPGEIPQPSKYRSFFSIYEHAFISVKPKIITTSDGLKPYRPDRRKCFFNSDRKLRFLKLYTQRNCELECLTNFTLSLCGCVKLHMPRNANTPICGPAKIPCCEQAARNLLNGRIKRGLNITEEENIRLNQLLGHCNCLPACNSITYDVDIVKLDIDFLDKTDKNDAAESRFLLFFKENEFTTLTRSEVYGTIDFIANCGGLIGLFIGSSFLSIVELLYYCSLRLYCNRRTRINRKRKNKMAISAVSKVIIIKEGCTDSSISKEIIVKEAYPHL